ncbi:MAG: hypothetical protein AUJ28_00455 [Parcubacteria group bacterium CG1_02_37_51]|uniref:Type II secretion system protein GspG C-terminal domain-containing protein n=2 Tax=Candidatus Komeiliibacteriota TaxID=1817908 RepID=A0A2M8DPV5_9BACT|nr:MAG: hypothetical protein AUJ28_00455 [Parcubacteria group bacterium CG1_02_37_51]PIY93779.1 MAG: hypothetical protein COY67_03640 [Candidatus Komeilibacteria bacterium CG_4_10_14_0_8_um_filter_37_78]PJC00957.1 MAG: hypothetical protein CO073_04835 [Candidatus Komeilibacteria bacterium CG_4_9_14_0_8_um_filter_36_9]
MKNKKGFTLIELLVVIAIIGLLSTLAVVSLNSARSKARDARRTSDIRQIQTALDMYYNDAGAYPAGAAIAIGTTAADTLSTGGFAAAATGTTYMVTVPLDPQNSGSNVYTYTSETPFSTYTLPFVLENDNATWNGNECIASPGAISCS